MEKEREREGGRGKRQRCQQVLPLRTAIGLSQSPSLSISFFLFVDSDYRGNVLFIKLRAKVIAFGMGERKKREKKRESVKEPGTDFFFLHMRGLRRSNLAREKKGEREE
jgi:hypothetical protein